MMGTRLHCRHSNLSRTFTGLGFAANLAWGLLAGALLVSAPGAQTARAQEEVPPPSDQGTGPERWLEPSVGTTSAAELGPIIDKLGAPSYAEREAATERLIETGPPAFLALRTAYRATEELEVKLRIERIVREAYLNYYVFDKNGFLGISQSRTPIEHEQDDRIQEGHVGVKVMRIIPDTAAERAELKQDDIVIALDGVPIPHSGAQVVADFGESVRVRGPGTKLTLTLLRGTEQIELDVALGRRPRRYYDSNQGQVYEMLENAQERFRAFWDEHFRETSTPEPDDDQP